MSRCLCARAKLDICRFYERFVFVDGRRLPIDVVAFSLVLIELGRFPALSNPTSECDAWFDSRRFYVSRDDGALPAR